MTDRTVVRASRLIVDAYSEPLRDYSIVMERGRILALGPTKQISTAFGAVNEEIRGTLIPGFVDAHTHMRALPLSEQDIPNRCLERWLLDLTAMTALPVEIETRMATQQALESGITAVQTIFHTFADAQGYDAAFRKFAVSLAGSGLRSLLNFGFTDKAEYLPDCLHDIETRIATCLPTRGMSVGMMLRHVGSGVDWYTKQQGNGHITFGVGSVAPQWCSTDALRHIARFRSELEQAAKQPIRVHTHLGESTRQRNWSKEGSPFALLRANGLLGPYFSAAHAVDIEDNELDAIAQAHGCLVHCPLSNDALHVGSASVRRWKNHGVTAALGSDSQLGYGQDWFDVMRAAVSVSRQKDRDDPLTTAEVFDMATLGGAKALGIDAGTLERGQYADMVALPADAENVSDVVTCCRAEDVHGVWVGGMKCMDERNAHPTARYRDDLQLVRALLQQDRGRRTNRLRRTEQTWQVMRSGFEAYDACR